MSKRQPAPPTRIQRSGNGHSYYLDGEKVPGVTTILSDGIPKTGLIGWASNIPADFVANLLQVTRNGEGRVRIVADELVEELRIWQQSRTGQKIVPWSDATPLPRAAVADALASLRFRDRDEAAGKGTEVHGLGDRLAHGEEVEVPEHLVGRGLLDIKTARSGIFSDVALQLQAYRFGETILRGLEEVPMPSVDFVAAIHVRADGYDVIPFDVTGDPNTDPAYRCFLYAKQVGEWLDWKEGPASRVRLDAATPPRNEGETP
jgi:hypothetical protein